MTIGGDCSREFIARQIAITVTITALEGLVHSKLRHVAETFAEHLSLLLCLEVRPERLHEELASLRHEKVRPAVTIRRVESRSTLDLARHILVIRGERIAELRVKQTTVAILVVSAHKEVHLVLVRERAVLAEDFKDLVGGDPALVRLV